MSFSLDMVEVKSLISAFYQVLQGIKCSPPTYMSAISEKLVSLFLCTTPLYAYPSSLKDQEFYFNGFSCGTSSENSSDQQPFVIADCTSPMCRNHAVNHFNMST